MLDKIKSSLTTKMPFVLYAKPNKNVVNGLFQRDSSLNYLDDFSQSGFVFAPFDDTKNSVLIPLKNSVLIQENWTKSKFKEEKSPEISYSKSDKKHFEDLVEKMILEIKKGTIKKIVASRREAFYPNNLDVFVLFRKMFHKYPTAFRSCFYHPKIGLWLGATPEKLLSVEKNSLQTMAYAGTQKFEGTTNVIWQEKEKQEQKFVTDFIVKNIDSEAEKIEISEPFTSRAGTLLHIQTDIRMILKNGFSLDKIVKRLHPTPAVCGLPKDLAKKFILENENYNRGFYSGFLGELNFTANKTSELYVNLRCMEIDCQKVYFYTGCGITKDSNPEREFFETLHKSVTMKSLF